MQNYVMESTPRRRPCWSWRADERDTVAGVVTKATVREPFAADCGKSAGSEATLSSGPHAYGAALK